MPRAMFVPVRAETGIWPQTVVPLTARLVAVAHDVPVQYCIVVVEVAELKVMQTWAVPVVMPVTWTS